MKDFLLKIAAGGGVALFVIVGIAQLIAAYIGAHHYAGWWALLIIGACVFLGFSLPVVVFSFLGAWKVWDWHWALALLFAAPGLIFVIPGMIGSIAEAARNRRRQ